jgi:uncharacterized protein (DUF1800 family)
MTKPALIVSTVLLALAAGGDAGAGVQSADQERCIDEMNRRGSLVAKMQNRAAASCVKDAGHGRAAKLGVPPQAQTAQACLTNDVQGKVAKKVVTLLDREASRCLAEPAQRPDFAYVPGATIAAAATAETTGLVAALFGPDLDAAIVPSAADSDGSRCQRETVTRTTKLFDRLWKETLRHKKSALKGIGRLSGNDPSAPVASAAELETEIRLGLAADVKTKIAKEVAKVAARLQKKCANTATPLGVLFPGCNGAADVAALTVCAEQAARASFQRSLAAFDELPVNCDLTDDGVANESCLDPALVEHVLNRIGYGPDAWSRARIEALGVEGYILEQLQPATVDDSALDAMLAQFPSLTMSFAELRANYFPNAEPGELPLGDILRELQEAKVLRAVASHRQLEQVLTDFWLNHFSIATSSRRQRYDVSPYERLAIRLHVLGSFRDLLLAIARSPAMGDYLDNRLNKVGDLNENYSREFMELHTMTVDGGYSEADVVEVARCFTGWREDYDAADGFRFQASWHDEGSKSILGGALLIPANGGEQDGVDVVDFFAAHAKTAEHVVRKLIVRFVSETPPAALLQAATGTYLATNGDLHAVLQTILLSPEFLEHAQYRKAKVKRPMHLFPSLARALGADATQLNLSSMRNRVRDLGEELYKAGPPTGYPDVSGFWSGPGAMILRFNRLERAAKGQDGYAFTYPIGGGSSAEIADALVDMLFVAPVSVDTRLTTVAFLDILPEPDPAARVEQAAAVLLSSPEFLLH